jgi:amidophosphoribosyltransferase
MCGIVGVVATTPVNQLLYDALLLLQHRGQDAAGICTLNGNRFHMHKGQGLARDVFRTRNMRSLPGNSGIAQVRYPTAGSASDIEEAQPFYVNAPFGITLVHNGNLTNADVMKDEMFRRDRRHVNTNSDSEVLLNVLAHELAVASHDSTLGVEAIFQAVRKVHQRIRGAYAVIAQIAGYGMLAFRDPFGIRPLVYGTNRTEQGVEYMMASESVTVEGLGFHLERDIAPGEAIFIDLDGKVHLADCVDKAVCRPCLFEYVYLARPDSTIDGVSVYATRLKLGEYLAKRVVDELSVADIDVVMSIPDSARPSAMQLANLLNLPYREGFIKNRYIGRTFIMPGQAVRAKSVRQKLNAIAVEFKGKNVLLVDDSIVRGTTSREIVQMARDAGANKVFFASSAPPVRFPNVYGIDMPTRGELIASSRNIEEIREALGADALIYQHLDDLKRSVRDCNPGLDEFEASCFDGVYITGDITPAYLDAVEYARHHPATDNDAVGGSQLSLAMSPNNDA